MVSNNTLPLPSWLSPSVDIPSGAVVKGFAPKVTQSLRGGSFVSCITTIAFRILAVLAVTLAVAYTLILWSMATVLVYPIIYVKGEHLINLISNLALPILSLSMLFGYTLPLNYFRRRGFGLACHNDQKFWNGFYGANIRGVQIEGVEAARSMLKSSANKAELAGALNSAARLKHEDAVKVFLDEGHLDPNVSDDTNGMNIPSMPNLVVDQPFRNALTAATESKHNSRIVKILLDHNASPNVPEEAGGRTPLNCAVINLSFLSVKYLLRAGALPNTPSGWSSATPMALAMLGNLGHDFKKITVGDPQGRSLASTRAIIKLLIHTEAFNGCREHFESLSSFAKLLNEPYTKENRVATDTALKTWVDDNSEAQVKNTFTFHLHKYLDSVITDSDDVAKINRKQQRRQTLAHNISVTIPMVIKAKQEVIEKYVRALFEANFMKANDGDRGILRLIAEYCYY